MDAREEISRWLALLVQLSSEAESDQIDGGIRNRCHEINMCAAPAIMWLPLVQRILKDRGVPAMSPATLLPLIEPCNGSVRDIVTAAQLFAAKLLKQTNGAPPAANLDAADQAAA